MLGRSNPQGHRLADPLLVRLGDYYREQGRTLDALRMFWLAPDETRKEAVVAEMAAVVSKWLREDGDG